ncbi:MAG: CHASE2 and HATPase_c domain-containing protein [Propionivibrio sp.]
MTTLPFRRTFSRGELRERGIVALALLATALVLAFSGVLARIDHLVFDAGQRLGGTLPAKGVVIVAIDEESLERVGRWPWSRVTHAQALATICAAAPAAIGFDVAFSEPSLGRAADIGLAKALRNCGRVVLPLVIETARAGGQLLETPPIPELVSTAAGLGRVGVRLDDDGIARSVDRYEGIGAASWPLFAAELLRVAGQGPSPDRHGDAAAEPGDPYALVREDERRITFVGPPGSIPRISFAQVLDGKVSPDMFAGRIVLIGATAVGLGDFLPTPVSAEAQPMPGVEVQGNILLSLRDGRLIRPLPGWGSALLCAALALLPLLWLSRLMPLAGLLASVAWVLLLVAGGAMLPVWFRISFAPTGAIVAGMLAFPLWSWHRLEVARRHLDQELRLLAAEPGIARPTSAAVRRMGFEARIAAVQAAQRRLRDLETQRNEALAFISHDLRSPLASAVQRLEQAAICDSASVLPALRRAQAMAQDFLQMARAEALDAARMTELDLVALLEQAADELYPVATQLGRKIVRVLPDDAVWVRGDFAALERCAINLLQNALTHAPAGGDIRLELALPGARPSEVRFSVANAGPAFSADERQSLFERYRRGAGAGGSTGAGLGLYYVRTVAERHGGAADVECVAGIVRFWVSLPVIGRGMPNNA